MRFGTAVVIGKFYPPHRGHKLLIEAAAAQAREVTVIVCAKPADTIPGELRGRWLQELHPAAKVLVIDDRSDENDTAVWAANTIRWLGGAPDAVFTSEDYGDPYAQAMGSVHVLVDRERTAVPCSATMIRSDPFAHWQYLEPPVRAWFARRVCVVGAESTGTTTLAEALARHYATVWVPEYGREYSVAKQARGETEWRSEEFVYVAQEQDAREERAARDANRVLICDTNSFATALWHRRYVGTVDRAVERATSLARCDLYLLTGDEIPFVQDGLRDGEHLRHEMHQWFEQALRAQAVPWLLVRGSATVRLQTAVAAIDALLR
ncbi:MAG: HTH-type transcriptional regulator, transcriptional repressor of biosynthesis s [Acidobacteriota bacterium]|jgi:NadR type nicotinamide-nucleotide adenylyltransferase|nr:HTH-type transcriptional regulator, transcriptional repressor of biosynthesis s [Acidobacteriota bacterium]